MPQYDDHVFINCPFDREYQPIFEALVSAVHDCGFVARSSLEADDGAEVRIEKIYRIIGECRVAAFRGQLPSICEKFRLREDSLSFLDYGTIVSEWLALTRDRRPRRRMRS